MDAERLREENARIKRDKENLASMMRSSQGSSRRNTDNGKVFDDASTGETRKSARDRKQTDRYGAGASCNAFITRQNFDRNRRQSQKFRQEL